MSDIEVKEEIIFEFEITEDISACFNKTDNFWYIMDYEEDEEILIEENITEYKGNTINLFELQSKTRN